MATADSAEAPAKHAVVSPIEASISQTEQESKLDDIYEGSEGLPETKKNSATWTVCICLLPSNAPPFPLDKRNVNVYKRWLSLGLDKKVVVDGLSSEAFASAVSQAFDPLLQDRPWAPLQSKPCDIEHFSGIPMLSPLNPDLDGSKYEFEFLRTHCALLDADGNVETLYIAIQHSIPSWDYLRTSNIFLPDFDISSEYDPMLDRHESLEVSQNIGERESHSNLSTTEARHAARRQAVDYHPPLTPEEAMVIEALQEHRRRREQAAARNNPTSGSNMSRLMERLHNNRQQRENAAALALNDSSSRLRSEASNSLRIGDILSNIQSRRVYFNAQSDHPHARTQSTSAEYLDSINKYSPIAHPNGHPEARTRYRWKDDLDEVNTAVTNASDSSFSEKPHTRSFMSRADAVRAEKLVSTVAVPPPTPTLRASQPLRGFSLAPDDSGHDIGPDAVWTRIKRDLVSTQVLNEAGLRYEARPDYVAVLGVLSSEEITELAQKSVEVRANREVEPPSKIEDQQSRSALVLSPDSAHLMNPKGTSSMDSAKTESTTITIRAAYADQSILESFFGRLFGYGKVSILWKWGRFQCTLPRHLSPTEKETLFQTVHRENNDAEGTHFFVSTTSSPDPIAASIYHKKTDDLSDLESLASVTDVPSLTSGTTFSSLGSQLDISEATEELAKLLLKDEELGSLFRASLQRTAADKVERNYTRLLAGFAKELRKEATNSVEHHVGRLVKLRARFISQTLVSALDPLRRGRTAQLESFLHQNEYTEGRLEQFLESLAMSGGFVEATKGAPPPIDSDENMSDESGEEGNLPKLSQIKDFILSSKALATLRTRLKEFVSPEEALSGEIQQSDIEGSQGAQGRSEGPLDGRLSNLETLLDALIGLVTRVDKRTVSKLTDFVLKIIRPRIPQDHQRISWTCGCGKPMYSDVQELYAGGAADLEHELRRAADGAARYRATSSSNNAPQGTMQLRQGSSSSNTSAISGSTLAPQPGANSTPSTSATQSGSIPTTAPGPGHLITNRFVLLCVNGPRFPQLQQVPLASQQVSIASHDNDQILFDNIRRAYIDVRRSYQPSFHSETPAVVKAFVSGIHRVWKASQKWTAEVFKLLRLQWLVWWIGDDVFFVPKLAEFVKFEVIPVKEEYIPEILESACLPPEEEVLNKNYHYAPCPQQVQNPLLRIPWLHVLFEPGAHSCDFWTTRTPKKLIQMLSYPSPNPVIGWGVHIVEGPNWHALIVLTIIFNILSLAISSIYCLVTSDVSSGFAVGSFFLAAETMVVTLVLAVVTTSLLYNK